MAFTTRLRRYALLGAKQGVVTCLTHQVSLPWGDAATGQFSVSETLSGELGDIVEVAFETRADGQWVEARNGRFVAVRSDGDVIDPAGNASYEARNLIAFLLSKLQLEPGSAELVDGARRFDDSTPGAILRTWIDEGKARGWGSSVTVDFTASVDSAGNAWESNLTLGYRPGQVTGWQALQDLHDQGVIDFWTEGRTLRVFNPDAGVDRTTGGAPLRLARLSRLPVRATIDSLFTDAVVYGDAGFRLDMHNDPSYAGLGRLEAAITQAGVSDPGTAAILAQQTLIQGSQLRREISADAIATAAPYPLHDFQVGDWVQAKVTTTWEPVKVLELVVVTKETSSLSVVLNDRFIDLTERLAKRTAGIIGGTVTGGTGGAPSADSRAPKAPAGVIASSTGYFAGTIPQAQISVAWAPVTLGENDVAIDVDQYELWAAEDEGDLQAVRTVTGTSASWSPVEPGTVYQVAVRARSKAGVWGELSAPETVTGATPTVEVGTPSAPIVSTLSGLVEVSWDGLTDAGGAPPTSFLHINVETSLNGTDGYELAATIWSAGERRIIQPGGFSRIWVRLVAVDSLGRESDPSDAVMVDVADLIPDGYIEARMLAAGVGGQLDLTANEAITLIVGQILAAQSSADDAAGTLADMRTYYQFGVDGAVISTPESPYQLRLKNDRIEMVASGVVIAYWQGGQMVVDSLSTSDAQIGNHKLDGSVAGHTTWRPL